MNTAASGIAVPVEVDANQTGPETGLLGIDIAVKEEAAGMIRIVRERLIRLVRQ